MRDTLYDDVLWRNLISRDFYPCKRVWDILNCSQGPMINLYSQVLCQRKILLMQLTKENKEMEESYNLLRARERLRIAYLVMNIILSWLSLPYLGVLQCITLFLYYQNIVKSLSLTLIPLFMIILILLVDVAINFVAWLVSALHIESSVLFQQWENMGFTFVKFTYEELYQDRTRSFFWLFALMICLFCFVLFIGLRVDHLIRWSWIFVFLPLWLALMIVFRTVPVKNWSAEASIVYKVILYMFGIPFFLFTVLLTVKLQWYHQLQLVVVFCPLWVMDFMLTIFVLGPTVTEFIRQSVYRNVRGILDTLDLFGFYYFVVFPKIVFESLYCAKDYFSNLSYSFSCIPLVVIMIYVCIITTSVCYNSFHFHQRVFSFYPE